METNLNTTKRSKQLNDLLNSKADRLTRYGAGLILLVLCLCLFTSWLMRYPDIIRVTSPVKRESDNTCGIVIPSTDTSRIKKGQKVSLKFHDLPFQQFGIVKGTIGSVMLTGGDSYLARIELPDGLVTNHGHAVTITGASMADVEVVVAYRRVSDKLLNALRKIGN